MNISAQRDNSGVLFKNDRKQSERAPDYTGAINVDGTEYQLSAWIKHGPKAKFMSLAVRPRDASAARTTSATTADNQHSDDTAF
jgi:hypothetical protein